MIDPAMSSPAFERVDNDAYYTPAWCTEALLSKWRPSYQVWEPAAGHGHIVEVLDKAGIPVSATDLYDYVDLRRDMVIEGHDFLSNTLMPEIDGSFSIITNPPYNKAEEFVRRALELTEKHRGEVAMLFRHEWDCAKSRNDLFTMPAFRGKVVLTKRPRWFEGTTTSPRHNFAWMIWDWRNVCRPILEYAP